MTLVAFDFDGTLSADEMVVLLAERAGVADEVATVTERAMAGEIPYATSLRERAALLSGLPEPEVAAAYRQVGLRPGAAELLGALADAGVETAVLTGGFERAVEGALARADAPVDHVVANRLPLSAADGATDGAVAADDTVVDTGDPDADEPVLTGDVSGPLVEGTKDDALASLAAEVGVDVGDAVAVGDGANDLPMLAAAGLAVGFRPKPAVRAECDVVVATMERLRRVFEDEGVL